MINWKQEDDKHILNVSETVEKVTRRALVLPPSPEYSEWWRWSVATAIPNHPIDEYPNVYAMGNAASEDEAKEMARRQLELPL